MVYRDGKYENIKIAYVGGGSRGWAWGLMSDLATEPCMSGEVCLYDIDYEAAKNNSIIGNMFNNVEKAQSHWDYTVSPSLEGALENADFVIISILPATFKEMKSDVHTPEKYGIYQSVGDTIGPGGLLRALRTIPMFEVIANGIKKCCPKAWVINYTNPMTLCVKTLYRVFPEIKAFGCCHEVFGTQSLLSKAYEDITGEDGPKRVDIKVNVLGVNHFTWLTDAHYRNIDLFPIYREFANKYIDTGYTVGWSEKQFTNTFAYKQMVKFDLFLKYGYIAAAGDRHLAEFINGNTYLSSKENVRRWGFWLTSVDWRIEDLKSRLKTSEAYLSGEKKVEIKNTGEEGVKQMKAILGLDPFITNVNIPNYGQIPNLKLGCITETNAYFSGDSIKPVFAGNIPNEIHPLISPIVDEQEQINLAGANRDLDIAFEAFLSDPLVTISKEDAKKLFDEMVDNTKDYLKEYLK